MRTQSISALSHEQEWLAEPVDPSGWLTGTPRRDRPAGGTDSVAEAPPTQSRPRRRPGRVERSVELGGARVVNSRRRRRMHSRSLLEQQVNDQTIERAATRPAVVDTEPEIDGYRLGRWARLALTLTVVATAAIVIGLLAAGSAPQVLVDVTVGPGDSLWSIASETAPTRDPRAVIEEIKQINGVTSDVLPIGVVLRVPAAED